MSSADQRSWVHDPDATLDYVIDWSKWLGSDEVITTFAVKVETGDVAAATSQILDGTKTVSWVSGGTRNTQATIRHRITTSAGRTDDRTLILSVRSR